MILPFAARADGFALRDSACNFTMSARRSLRQGRRRRRHDEWRHSISTMLQAREDAAMQARGARRCRPFLRRVTIEAVTVSRTRGRCEYFCRRRMIFLDTTKTRTDTATIGSYAPHFEGCLMDFMHCTRAYFVRRLMLFYYRPAFDDY